MTNAIVVNTITGAVSEYSNFAFNSITPAHAGNAAGLYALGGDLDVAAPIVAIVTTGKTQWGSSLLKFIAPIYFALKGSGTSSLTVIGEAASYNYPFAVSSTGESRAIPGKGIRESYIALTYSNDDGADFWLDSMEVSTNQSKTRRI